MPKNIEGAEGFDLNSLITESEENFDEDGAPAQPAKGQAERYEEADDADDDDDAVTLEDIEALIEKKVSEKKAEAQSDDDEEEVEYLTPDQRRIRELEQENARLKARDDEAASKAVLEKAAHEVKSAIGKLRMTQEQVDLTVDYFEKNPDLEGVVSFEKAARRVNPELNDRHQPNPGAGSGPAAGEVAEVITRGAGGPGASTPFKPVAARGSYSAVTAAIRSSSAVRNLIRVE